MPDLPIALANGAGRIRVAMAGRTTDVDRDLLGLLDEWVENFGVWKASSEVPVWFVASTSTLLDQLTCRLIAPAAALMPDVADSFSVIGAEAEPVALLARLGEEVQPATVGTWFHVGADGVDAGWVFPGAVTVGELRRAGAPAELVEWADRAGIPALAMLEGSVGADAFVGGAALLADAGSPVEEIYDALGQLGVDLPPPALLVPIEELHHGPVWISAWFVPGAGVVRTGVIAVGPSAELVVAAAMATDADEERLARFGAAVGAPLPALLEVDTWTTGPSVRLHHDVRADGVDPDDGELDDPWDDDQVR